MIQFILDFVLYCNIIMSGCCVQHRVVLWAFLELYNTVKQKNNVVRKLICMVDNILYCNDEDTPLQDTWNNLICSSIKNKIVSVNFSVSLMIVNS